MQHFAVKSMSEVFSVFSVCAGSAGVGISVLCPGGDAFGKKNVLKIKLAQVTGNGDSPPPPPKNITFSTNTLLGVREAIY